MDDVRPQNEPHLEDEGIPDHEGPPPSKVRTADQGAVAGATDRADDGYLEGEAG